MDTAHEDEKKSYEQAMKATNELGEARERIAFLKQEVERYKSQEVNQREFEKVLIQKLI